MAASVSPVSPVGPAPVASTSQSSDLWSSILDSVAGSRGVVTKNIIILGGPRSGKSTLLARISNPTGEAPVAPLDDSGGSSEPLDLGLSYSSFDVSDETDEETVARLGVYQLPSPAPPYPSLLPLALSRSTLLDSIAVIVLDWERPWRFLRELQSWIGVLHGVLKGKGVAEGHEGQEARERLESHWRHYVEPPSNSSSIGPSATQLPDLDAPLPPGVLTDNLGLGLVIVCTKSDQINALERDKNYKEEQFDYIQQVLRTVALRYGAAIFFTTHARPLSFVNLRAYLLHRLFAQPPSSASATVSTAPVSVVSTSTRAFAFSYRANVVDRDQVLVPTGWDTWGKIKILRGRFDPDAVSSGWERDLEKDISRLEGREAAVDDHLDAEGRRLVGAVRRFDEMIVNLEDDNQPISMANSRVEVTDEQDFLKVHYEKLQKEREKDPRNAFATRAGVSSAAAIAGLMANGESGSYTTSVVGPMLGAAPGLTSVERVLERDRDDVVSRLSKASRRESVQGSLRPPVSPSHEEPSPLLNGIRSSTLLSPTGTTSGGSSTTSNPAQNEVLQTFFQSLLEKRGTAGSVGLGGGASAAAASRDRTASPAMSSAVQQNGSARHS